MTYHIEDRVRRNRRWLMAAIAVVALALVAGGIGLGLVLSGGSGPADTTGSRSGIYWMSLQGEKRLPVSAQHGPFVTQNGRAWGFTHDRMGAVMAAAHISMRAAPSVGPDVYWWTFRHQVVGTSEAAFTAQVSATYQRIRRNAGLPPGAPLPSSSQSRIVGYRVESYNPQGPVKVHLLHRGTTETGSRVLVDFTTRLRWENGGWRLIAPPGGEWQAVTAAVPSRQGYTLFPGGGR